MTAALLTQADEADRQSVTGSGFTGRCESHAQSDVGCCRGDRAGRQRHRMVIKGVLPQDGATLSTLRPPELRSKLTRSLRGLVIDQQVGHEGDE